MTLVVPPPAPLTPGAHARGPHLVGLVGAVGVPGAGSALASLRWAWAFYGAFSFVPLGMATVSWLSP